MKKWDYILIALILATSFIPYLHNLTNSSPASKVTAEIYVDNKLVRKVDIIDMANYNKPIEIESKYGHNTLMINNKGIYVSAADCPDHICMNSKPIKDNHRVIACLPNRFYIKISTSSNDGDDIDLITD